MIYVSFFFTCTLLVMGLFAARSEKQRRLQRRIALATNTAADELSDLSANADAGDRKRRLERALSSAWRSVRRSFRRKLDAHKQTELERKLLQAGQPFGLGAVDFRLLQIVIGIGLPIGSIGCAALIGASVSQGLLMLLVAAGIAAGLPGMYLRLKSKERAKAALKELPDVLDLLTVSLEAGLGFDSALSKLVSKKEGVLAGEFQRCLEEIRLGRTRREALIGVRDRLVLDEIRVLVSSILQAEKLGIGMVQVLRIQSQEARERRKQRAEEEAMKAPIKMMFPLVLFVFPTLFIVLLGPALIQLIQTFGG